MFDDQTQPSSNPLNPIMPSPGMTPPPPGSIPPPPSAPTASPVHTMPERFRAAGGPPQGSKSTKKLVIILIAVVVVGGLAFGGLYVFQNVLNKNTANSNTVVTNTVNRANTNTTVNAANDNTSANTNTAANLNVNVNTNTTANTNVSTNSNTNTTPVVISPLPSSADSDGDGLTDAEEAVYGTDPAKADTDGDGFIDGKQVRADGSIVGEFILGYNPKGTGQLETSGLVKRVQDTNSSYSVLVPTSWTSTADQNGGVLVTPTQQTGELFQVAVNDNPNRLAPKDWYRTNNPTANIDSLTTFAVNGLAGIYSEDESTGYIFKDTKVYSIFYNTGSLTQVNYRTTFDMMVRSFKLVAS